jgi:hypothetical protein
VTEDTGYYLDIFASNSSQTGMATNVIVNNTIISGYPINVLLVTGTGTSSYIPKFTNSSGLINSSIYETGGFVGIGMTNSQAILSLGAQTQPLPANTSLWLQGGKTIRMGSSDSDANYGAYIKPDFGGSNSSLTLGVRDAGVDTDVLKFISGKIGIHASPDAFARVTIGGSIAKMLFSSSVAGNSIVINSPSSTYLFGLQVTGAGGLARLSLGRTTSASNAFSNEDLTVYDNGDIGINKTVPVSDLDVAGHINAFNITGLQLYGSSTGQNVTGYDIRALKTLYISGQTVVTGDIYNKLYQTGVNLMALITAASTGVSAINGVSGLVSIVGTGDIYVTTNGQVITVSGNSGNFATRTELFNTGSNIYNLINTTTGYLNTNPSGFITTGQTGQFYPASNPNDYATTLFVNSQDNVVSLKVDSLSGLMINFQSIEGEQKVLQEINHLLML